MCSLISFICFTEFSVSVFPNIVFVPFCSLFWRLLLSVHILDFFSVSCTFFFLFICMFSPTLCFCSLILRCLVKLSYKIIFQYLNFHFILYKPFIKIKVFDEIPSLLYFIEIILTVILKSVLETSNWITYWFLIYFSFLFLVIYTFLHNKMNEWNDKL